MFNPSERSRIGVFAFIVKRFRVFVRRFTESCVSYRGSSHLS
ncbi:hypothetical protein [Chryseobacterium indoltheticum]